MSLVVRGLAALLLLSVGVYADEPGWVVSGRVTDSSGGAVPHASIKLYNRATSELFEARADDEGRYQLTAPPGDYLISAGAPGLHLTNCPSILKISGPVELPLELGVGEVSSTIEVTATGTPQSLDETAKAVDVITQTDLDKRGAESVVDGLREVAGLRVEQRGGPGENTTIQMRGMRTFDTDVLIDGMRFRDVGATQGDASSFLTDLLLVDTNRIEVMRGAGSSIYGTNAIGGVINIITDEGNGPFHGSLTADGGGLGEFRGLVKFGGSADGNRFHYSAGAGHQDVTNGVGNFGRYRNTTGNGLVDYAIRPGVMLSGRLLATGIYGQLYDTANAAPAATLPAKGYLNAIAPAESQLVLAQQRLPYSLNGATFVPALGDPDYFRTANFVSSMLTLQQQLTTPLSYRVSYQAMLLNRDVINGPLGAGYQPTYRTSNEFNGRIDTVRAQLNYAPGAHELFSAGYEFEREYFDSPASDNNPNLALRVNSRTQVAELSHSADAQNQVRLFRDRLQISLSGRIQHFLLEQPTFLGTVPVYANTSAISPPNAYTADASIAYFIRSTGSKIRSHVGNGYRKPSLYELFGTSFYGSSFTAYGDPRLKPERSVAIDGGIDQYFAADRVRLSASYFYTRLQEVIAYDSSGLINPATDPFGRSSGYRNTGGGMARGAELSTELRPLRSTQVTASYTYTNARDKYSEFVDGTLQIPRVTPNSFSVVALQQFGKHVDASFEFLGSSDYLYQLSRRTFVFPGARQAAVSTGYSRILTESLRLRVYARISNVLGQTYYEDGFRTPNRWAVGGFTLSF